MAPDSKDFRNRDPDTVPKDEVYLFKYFTEKLERKGEKTKEEDNVSVTSAEFNDYLDSLGGEDAGVIKTWAWGMPCPCGSGPCMRFEGPICFSHGQRR